MKRILSTIVFSFILFAFVVVVSACTKSLKRIEVAGVLNLGHINISDTTFFVLPLKNISKQSLIIDYVNTPCGCLRSSFKTSSIRPGENSNAEFLYKPMNLGYVEQNIFIYFIEFNTPVHVLVKCYVVK